MPVDEDYEEARIPVKDRKAEENAIRDIAYAVESFYIRSEVNDSTDVVAKIRENLEYERVFLEDQEKDWKKIRWLSDDRCEVTNRGIAERHLNLQVCFIVCRYCWRSTTSACLNVWTACNSRRTTSLSAI